MRRRKQRRRKFKPVDIEEWKALEYMQGKIILEHEKLELRRLRRYERLQKLINKRGKNHVKLYVV